MQIWNRILILAAPALLTFCLAACSNSQTPAPGVASPENSHANANPIAAASNTPTVANNATAANPAVSLPRIVFILDASGSMLGRVGQEEKMAVARRVLKDSIARLPENAEVGLIAYGHRRKNDCADIEVLSQLKALDKAAVSAQIDLLKPSGMTPITNSLEKAFDLVKAQPGTAPVTVVLLTDGLETCKGDPCKLAADAKKAGLNFVLHVIGFDVGKLSVAQLECVAQAGNGLYLGAQNGDELAAALAGTVTPKEVAAGRLSIGAMLNGKLTDVVVKVYRAGTKEEVTNGRTYESAETNPRILPIAAGTYDVEAQAIKLGDAPIRRFQGVEIVDGKVEERIANFGSGEMAIGVTRNGKLSDAAIVVYVSGSGQEVASGRSYVDASSNPHVFRLEPGKYDVLLKSTEISGGPTVRLTEVVIDAGQQAKRTHDFSSGTLRIGAARGGQLIDAVVNAIGADNKSQASGRTYTSASSNPKAFELLPGRYRVRVSPVRPAGLSPQEIEIEIKPGETVERTVEFSK